MHIPWNIEILWPTANFTPMEVWQFHYSCATFPPQTLAISLINQGMLSQWPWKHPDNHSHYAVRHCSTTSYSEMKCFPAQAWNDRNVHFHDICISLSIQFWVKTTNFFFLCRLHFSILPIPSVAKTLLIWIKITDYGKSKLAC